MAVFGAELVYMLTDLFACLVVVTVPAYICCLFGVKYLELTLLHSRAIADIVFSIK